MSRARRLRAVATLLAAAVAVGLGFLAPAAHAVPDPYPVKLGGGSPAVFSYQNADGKPVSGRCTLTAVGHDDAGNAVGLTNGHCVGNSADNVGAEVYAYEGNGKPDEEVGVIGVVTYVDPHVANGGKDYLVIKFDEAKVDLTSTVGEMSLHKVGPPPSAGTVVCKQGSTTALTCGAMLGSAGFNFAHTIWVAPGDSGSPVAYGDTLIGHTWVAGGSVSMVLILKDIDARGGTGAGFTLAP